MAFYGHEAIPEWQNSLLVAVLKNSQLVQLELNEEGTEVIAQNIFLADTYGRLRDVWTIPDGRIFISTTNRDYAGNPSFGMDKIIELKSEKVVVKTTQLAVSDDMEIYPNPARKALTISCDAPMNGLLRVIDVSGKEIYRTNILSQDSHTLSVAGMEAGTYYVKLRSKDMIYTKKFMVLPQ